MKRLIISLLFFVTVSFAQDTTWTKTYGGSNYDFGYYVQQTTDGGYIITGRTDSFGNGGSDVWLIKTYSNGDSLWSKTFGGSNNDECHLVEQTTDGGYILIGITYSYGIDGSGIWLIKTDTQGNEEWYQIFGGISYDRGLYVHQTTDGGYIITGDVQSFGNGETDVILIKTDPQGNTVPESEWE